MATININVGANDVLNINVVNQQQNDEKKQKPLSEKDLYEKLHHDLVEKSNNSQKPFWYEVFYDFFEDFGKIYPVIKEMPYEVAFTYCWGLLNDYDAYYDSDQYIKDLNEMLKKC